MRTALAITLLLGCCGMDTFLRFQNTRQKLQWWGQGDPVSNSSKRIEAIRSQLPKRGLVAYQFHGEDSSPANDKLERLMAKYNLAPLIVTTTGKPEIFLDDDQKTVKVSGGNPNYQSLPADKRPSRAIDLLWLVWAWGLPCLALFRLLNSFSQSAATGATPTPAWGWFLWLIGVSLGASLGLSSALFALWNFLCGAPTYWYIILESSFWMGLVVLTNRKGSTTTTSIGTPAQVSTNGLLKSEDWNGISPNIGDLSEEQKKAAPDLQRPAGRVAILCAILLCVSIGLMLYECLIWNERRPDGIDDAIWIYNLRARFMHRSPDDWSDAFSPEIWHPDYPLLLPASVARGWYFTDSESVVVPISVSDLFLLGLVTILVSAASLLRGLTVGCLLGIVILSTPETLKYVMSQIADVPFSYFMAITITSWVVARRWPAIERTAWLAFGISLGAAVWLKNEGLTLAAIGLFTVVTFERTLWNRRSLVRFWVPLTAGCGPFLLAWTAFHIRFPTTSDIIAGQGSTTASQLFDGTRHGQILSSAAVQFLTIGPCLLPVLCVYAGMLGFVRDTTRRWDALGPALLLTGQFLCYYLVYSISPHDLKWHLSTSLERVFQHLWPAAAFLIFAVVRSPAERLAYDAAQIQHRLELEDEFRR